MTKGFDAISVSLVLTLLIALAVARLGLSVARSIDRELAPAAPAPAVSAAELS